MNEDILKEILVELKQTVNKSNKIMDMDIVNSIK